MKRFLIITSSLLVISLVISVIAYWFVVTQLPPVDLTSNKQTTSNKTTSDSKQQDGLTTDLEKEVQTSVPEEGIPLRNLPLGDTQKSLLKNIGVDTETFIITPSMHVCAEEKLGPERMKEIIAGEAPTLTETARLTSCLGAG